RWLAVARTRDHDRRQPRLLDRLQDAVDLLDVVLELLDLRPELRESFVRTRELCGRVTLRCRQLVDEALVLLLSVSLDRGLAGPEDLPDRDAQDDPEKRDACDGDCGLGPAADCEKSHCASSFSPVVSRSDASSSVRAASTTRLGVRWIANGVTSKNFIALP